LADFLGGLLDVAGEMAVRDVLAAMCGRYGLGPPALDAEATLADEQARPEVELVRQELADGVLAQLTDRQLQVLLGLHQERSVRNLAGQLNCSVGTISSETNAIRKALSPLGSDAGSVLNEVLDRAFRTNV